MQLQEYTFTLGVFAIYFLQNHTVTILESNTVIARVTVESTDRTSKPIKKAFYECLNLEIIRMH